MTRVTIVVFLAGLVCGLLVSHGVVLVKNANLFGTRPDRVLVYRQVGDQALALHVFEARRRARDIPATVLVLFHGGAWQYGSPTAFYPQCEFFAGRGFTCISVEYRVESRHGTDPRAAVQDARAALAYIRHNAAALGVDPDRIVVGGGSAGGHLAACLGVPVPLAAEDGAAAYGFRPRALILYNPMIDLSPCRPDHHLVADFWYDVSPLQHIDAAVPPSLILMGTRDPELSTDTAQRFCNEITRRGGTCELALYEGAKHGFFNRQVAGGRYFAATNDRILAFLAAHGLSPRGP